MDKGWRENAPAVNFLPIFMAFSFYYICWVTYDILVALMSFSLLSQNNKKEKEKVRVKNQTNKQNKNSII